MTKSSGKRICIIAVIIMTLLFQPLTAGCGSSAGDGSGAGDSTAGARNLSNGSAVDDVLQKRIDEANKAKAEGSGSAEDTSGDIAADDPAGDQRKSGVSADAPTPEPVDGSEAVLSKTEGIDVDLTILSSTVVYSEVYNMMYLPEEYIGKTIKMRGMFSSYHDEDKDKYYYACIIQDATACCAQGIEFELEGEHSPEDYPDEGQEVTVEGVFDTYVEDDYTYCTLRNAHFV